MQYETEEQQVEALKEWWRENGRAVILGVVIGAALIVAWTWYQKHQQNQAAAASDLFSQSIDAINAGEYDKVAGLADQISDEHSDSLYAAYTQFAAARAAVEQGNLEDAATRLEWVVDHTGMNDVVLLGKVRLARVKGAMGDPSAGLSSLPASYAESFTALVEEARGDLLSAAGDAAAARSAYETALDQDNVPDANAVRMKLNELAGLGS